MTEGHWKTNEKRKRKMFLLKVRKLFPLKDLHKIGTIVYGNEARSDEKRREATKRNEKRPGVTRRNEKGSEVTRRNQKRSEGTRRD